MRVVILQPSYIPWRGYFHQIYLADLFIFYDDVQYDKRGWRNRNQIKTSQGKQWLTIPVHSHGVHQGIPISQVRIDWSKPWAKDHQKALALAYSKSPFYHDYSKLLVEYFDRRDEYLADFTINTTISIARNLGIHHTQFIRSSELPGIEGKKSNRLLNILKNVGGTHYISGPSARDYLELDKFYEQGIHVEFMQYAYQEYPQLHPPFEPSVSILDLLFMTGSDALSYIT